MTFFEIPIPKAFKKKKTAVMNFEILDFQCAMVLFFMCTTLSISILSLTICVYLISNVCMHIILLSNHDSQAAGDASLWLVGCQGSIVLFQPLPQSLGHSPLTHTHTHTHTQALTSSDHQPLCSSGFWPSTLVFLMASFSLTPAPDLLICGSVRIRLIPLLWWRR